MIQSSTAWKLSSVLRCFSRWQLDLVFFLKSTALYRCRVVAKPGFGVFNTHPLQRFSRDIDHLFATRQNVTINDRVQFSVAQMVRAAKNNVLGVQPGHGLPQQHAQLSITQRIGGHQLQGGRKPVRDWQRWSPFPSQHRSQVGVFLLERHFADR